MAVLGRQQRIDPGVCWNCDARPDAVRGILHNERPGPGAFMVCGHCNAPQVVGEGLSINKPTSDQALAMMLSPTYMATFFTVWLTRHGIGPPT